ncbi:MAG TPA: methyltransferase domain-containing protein [Vicinamibacteria bacterium]|jgi:SAM-dependent methyltransferase
MTAAAGSAGFTTFSSAMGGATGYHRWLMSAFAPHVGRCVLEVGFGHEGLRGLLPAGTRYVGLDVDPAVVEAARRRAPGDAFVCGDVGDPGLGERLAGLDVDTVLCVNVLEHVADDAAAARGLLRLLPAGGRLIVFVPAFRALYNDLDRLAGHLRRYRRAEVRALVPPEGRVLALEYFNPVGGVGWWLNRFLRHHSLERASVTGQVRFFDRWVLPASRLLNPLTRSFFGQSVLCVAEHA